MVTVVSFIKKNIKKDGIIPQNVLLCWTRFVLLDHFKRHQVSFKFYFSKFKMFHQVPRESSINKKKNGQKFKKILLWLISAYVLTYIKLI